MTTQTPPPADLMAPTDQLSDPAIFAAAKAEHLNDADSWPGSYSWDELSDWEQQHYASRAQAVLKAFEAARPSLSAQAVGDDFLLLRQVYAVLQRYDGEDDDFRTVCERVFKRLSGNKIEAAESNAALWVNAQMLADSNFTGINAVRSSHPDIEHYTVPLYTTPPQPADGGDSIRTLVRAYFAANAALAAFHNVPRNEGRGLDPDEMEELSRLESADEAAFEALRDADAALAKFQPAGGENDG